jgi:hypothetical protein
VIGASCGVGAAPFNKGVAPLARRHGYFVRQRSQPECGIDPSAVAARHVTKDAQASASTFLRLVCGPASSEPADPDGDDTQLSRALARATDLQSSRLSAALQRAEITAWAARAALDG